MPRSSDLHIHPPASQRAQLDSYEVRLMVRDLLDRQGLVVEEILAGTGVSARQLENPGQRLTLEQELLLYNRIAQLNRDPLLGIRTGARLSLPDYGVLGHAMMGAGTLHEALLLLTEFAPLVSWASHSRLGSESCEGVDCRSLTLFPTAVDPPAAALEVESTFASLQSLFNDLAGEPVRFAAVEMTHAGVEELLPSYAGMFRCAVRFECPRNALLIPKSVLTARLPHPQPEYAGLFRDLCQQSMSALTEDRGLIAIIKSLILSQKGEVPTLERVAAHFNLSSRTLRRHLHDVGVSYQGLRDEVRYAEARRYLASTGLPVETIGKYLGYADARSFRTAFKRWSGQTPAAFRGTGR